MTTHHAVKLPGRIADGVKPADEGAHARTHHDVDGQAGALDDFQGADVGHALGAAATQHDGHALAPCGGKEQQAGKEQGGEAAEHGGGMEKSKAGGTQSPRIVRLMRCRWRSTSSTRTLTRAWSRTTAVGSGT